MIPKNIVDILLNHQDEVSNQRDIDYELSYNNDYFCYIFSS